MAIDTADWGIVLFSFEYIKDLERTAEASTSEIARLDSINEFRLALHVSDSIQIAEARVSRIASDSKADALVKEIKRQKRRKIGGTIGGFLFGFGIGVIGGWAASR